MFKTVTLFEEIKEDSTRIEGIISLIQVDSAENHRLNIFDTIFGLGEISMLNSNNLNRLDKLLEKDDI